MKLALFAAMALAIVCLIPPDAAFALVATGTTWSPGPLYIAAEPYILVAFGAVFSGLFGWACTIFQRHTGVAINQAARDAVQTAAMNAAGRIMVSQDATFAAMKVDLHSPLIAAQIPVVSDVAADAISKLGITPARVGALIAGKLGQLQAQAMSGTPISPVAK